MALVLTKEIAPNGNYDTTKGARCPLSEVPVPQNPGRKMWARTGGDAVVLDCAKADGLVFKPWEPVVCPGGKSQEDAILHHLSKAYGANPPIQRLDVRQGIHRDELFSRHPEYRPKSDPGSDDYFFEVAELIRSLDGYVSPDGSGRIGGSQARMSFNDLDAKPWQQPGKVEQLIDQAKGASAPPVQTQLTTSPDEAYDASYTKNRAKGHSEAKAAGYAEVARKNAEKRAEA